MTETVLKLRPYQERCIREHFRYFETHDKGNPLFVLPTGSGKSIVIAEFIRQSREAWPATRFLVLAHVRELVEQNYLEFLRNGGQDAGIYSAGLKRRDTDSAVLFASIQSVYQRAEELGSFDIVLADEAHLWPKKGFGRYRSYFADLAEINPQVRVCGYTATHFRLDGGYLHEGKGRIFHDVAYEETLDDLIAGGYLVPIRSKQPHHVIDVSQVPRSAWDFKIAELEAAAMAGDHVAGACHEIVTVAQAARRSSWLIFCCTVRHALEVEAQLQAQGIDVDTVFGHTKKDERDETIRRFREGELTALVNVNALTTGFNAPRTDLMAILRPTQSAALFLQMCGRGMRRAPGKLDCIMLDFGGNIARHGPLNMIQPKFRRSDGSEKDAPPTKACPECGEIVILGLRECPGCSYIFPRDDTEHAAISSWYMPLDPNANRPVWYPVIAWFFSRHQKPGKPDSVKIEYRTDLGVFFREWVFPEHERAAWRVKRWWREHRGQDPIPADVGEFLDRVDELAMPSEILVGRDGKYHEIRNRRFPEPGDS